MLGHRQVLPIQRVERHADDPERHPHLGQQPQDIAVVTRPRPTDKRVGVPATFHQFSEDEGDGESNEFGFVSDGSKLGLRIE